jgi:hypothetical protein
MIVLAASLHHIVKFVLVWVAVQAKKAFDVEVVRA